MAQLSTPNLACEVKVHSCYALPLSAGIWRFIISNDHQSGCEFCAIEIAYDGGKLVTENRIRKGSGVAKSKTSNLDLLGMNAGLCLRDDRLEDAAKCYREILATQAQNRIALFNLAQLLQELGQEDEAKQFEKRFLALGPGAADLEIRKASYLYARGKFPEAIAGYRAALAMGHKDIELYRGLGEALYDSGSPKEALESYGKALKLAPRKAVLWGLCAEANFSLAQYEEALECTRQALNFDPDMILARSTAGLTHLLLGDYEKGLALNEERLNHESREWLSRIGVLANLDRFAAKPRWKGEDLQGKTILIWTEQGLGDSLMLMRYIPMLKEKGASGVVVYCPPSLVKTMLTVTPLVVNSDTSFDSRLFDVHCSIMSLPYFFGTRVDTIPAVMPYLTVEASAKKVWGEQLKRFTGLKVGIAWAGNKKLAQDKLRSIAFERLAPVFDVRGVQFVSLQKELTVEGEKLVARRILDWMPACKDIMDTAALISQLDLVISVDTMIAHLAGALGKPVWLFNRFESDWRWMRNRSESPWYPNTRIFRQPALHDWDSVIANIVAALTEKVGTGAEALDAEAWSKAARDANRALGIANSQSGQPEGWRQKLTSLWKR